MLRIYLLALCAAMTAMTLSESNVVGQQPQTTTWTGTIDVRDTKLRLEIDITQIAGKLSGELRSLDQGNAQLKTADIEMDGENLSFSIPQIGAKFKGTIIENGGVAKGTFSQSGMNLPLTLTKFGKQSETPKPEKESTEKLEAAWIGELNMGIVKPIMQFRIVKKEDGQTGAYFDSVTEGRTGFAATWSIEGDQLNFDVAEIKLKYRGTLNEAGDVAEGIWSQGGREVPLTLKKQAAAYSSENVWENRPQRPVAPFPYESEEVTLDNTTDAVTLAGTLTIPAGAGRHPAVILISGSGPSDRDESIMEHKPFLVLADYLTRRGIAVLRYDDRGTGESTGDFGTATTEDFARDASAAVEFLKNHDRINSKQIGLAGHSEGGLIAPMVVGLRDDVAFVVLLAATGVDGVTINETQTEAMLRAGGTPEFEIKLALAVNRAFIGAAMKADPGEDFSDAVEPEIEKIIETIPAAARDEAAKNIRQGIGNARRQLKSNWMRFFLAYDPRPALKKIKCPVLAIAGSKDLQVLPDLNIPEIKKALSEGGNPDFEIVVLDGLNHLFQKCETGSMNEYISIQETFNPLALQRIGDWIVAHTSLASD